MDSRYRSPQFAAAFCLVLIIIQVSSSTTSVAAQDFNPSFPEAIEDALGFQSDDLISGFDLRDSKVGKSVVYDFIVQIGDKVMPSKLVEDVNRWEYGDLPIFRSEHP